MFRSRSIGSFLILIALTVPAMAQEEKKSDKKSKIGTAISGMKMRSIGPALMSGRIADIAVDHERPNQWYVAVGSGGVWKTENAGTTWTPIFDNYDSYSIGCVTIDPNNRNTIWVGTGESVGGRHAGFGDGVYVSHDGGASFNNVGLRKTEHIAKILVDPKNSNTIYVASQGPLWSEGGERGLYKSVDAGKTWELILSEGPWTGVTDVVFETGNSNVLYAATHQRHRTVAALLNGGPETAIHKSTDSGKTWSKLTNGIPGGDKGKIALAVSPQRSNVVYASIEMANRGGGFYRSTNRGASWEKMSDYVSGGTGPHYYQEIWADPHQFDVIYHANVVLGRSMDGGKTFEGIGNRNKHVDNHAVAFHPTDSEFLLVGCDGGLYKSFDRGQTYDFTENLPLTQFYKLDVDYDWPIYHVVGGTQDNNTQYGPSQTMSRNGIRNADWRITIGGDGHDCAIDPKDPNIIYCESQQGYLRRFDRRTGESVDIRPQPDKGQSSFRFNWDSPIHISPHSNTRIYFGSRILHRSDDRGDSWEQVSGDLSRQRDRLTLPMMGRVWSVDAIWDLMAMSQHSNITSISESPKVEGLIYIGTDDGLIQVTEDGGKNWRKIERLFDVPEFFFVNDIKADLHDPDTVYVCIDNHKEGDYKAYVFKSTDRGRSWHSIVGDLPERHICWRINQDHEQANLLFLGTEYGAFASVNGGENWHKLGGTPNIPFRDLEIQRRENDLVGATFGRGFYVLDDYSPLRSLNEEQLSENEFVSFDIKDALLYVPQDRLGGRFGSQGDSYYSADNPPFGAVFTYFLKNSFKTKKQERKEAETELQKAGKDNPAPDWEHLKAESRESAPKLIFEITDSSGGVVDRIDGSASAGLQRIAWNLRYAPYTASSGGRFGGSGPLVAPGTYKVQAYKQINGEITKLGESKSFAVRSVIEPTLPLQDRKQVLAFQDKVGKLQRSVTAANREIEKALEEVRAISSLAEQGRKLDIAMITEARSIEQKLLDAQEWLSGDSTKSDRHVETTPSISGRIQNALFGTMFQSYGPTKTHRDQLKIANEEYSEVIGKIRKLVYGNMKRLRKKLDEAGAPWTPGRQIPDPK